MASYMLKVHSFVYVPNLTFTFYQIQMQKSGDSYIWLVINAWKVNELLTEDL